MDGIEAGLESRVGWAAFLIVVAAALAPDAACSQSAGDTLRGIVVKVKDGDTCVLQANRYGRVTVRLHGADAPERGQPRGRNATLRARALLEGEEVRVGVQGEGPYGGLIGAMGIGDCRAGERLVREGHAWHAKQQAPDNNRLQSFQRKARRLERGLWARPTPVPPWAWRTRN